MIALAPARCSSTPRPPLGTSAGPEGFLVLLPLIRRIARHAFGGLSAEHKADAIQEVIASAYVAYVRLVQRGKQQVAYATPLAHYAVAQYRSGRRVGCSLNIDDISSQHCQQHRQVVVERVYQPSDDGNWKELLVEDRRSTPADIAATRLDFRAWLRQLDRPRRAAARLLAGGIATSEAAKKLRLTPARISQLRRELMANWEAFQGEAKELAVA